MHGSRNDFCSIPGLSCKIKANCPYMGPGPTGGVPSRQMRCDFSNRPGRPGKREMRFPTAGSGYKKRKTKNIAGQSG